MPKLLSKFLLGLFFIFNSEVLASLQPAVSRIGAPSNDELLTYQWALFNQGQVITSDLDDIHLQQTVVDKEISIGWKNFDALMKKDVVVAVIDSGLDSAHPEIHGHLVPGYNFVAQDSRTSLFTDDDMGHGTHISGIIAAEIGNGKGIAGMSNRIRIMPLKVYDSHEKRSTGESRRPPISERVARAVDFAVDKKVDVILLSMGWPRAANSERVRTAFLKALKSGISVVAAAGNDHHDAQIFPCAYSGVICVAAVDGDGKLSRFSNYGGHVDLAAPGQEILSLWPQTLRSSRFGPKGYDLKSGTSQAAPFVAGSLAILRGIFPNESSENLRARVLVSAQGKIEGINLGMLNLQKAIQADVKQFIAPLFKEIEILTVDKNSGSFEFPLLIENFGVKRPEIEVISLSPGVSLQLKSKLPRAESKNVNRLEFRIRGQARDQNISSRLLYAVRINGREFRHQILLSRSLTSLTTQTSQMPESEVLQRAELHSVSDFRYGRPAAFWAFEKISRGIRLHLWHQEKLPNCFNPNETLIKRTVDLTGISAPQDGFGLVANDWLSDGGDEYLFAATEKDNEGRPVRVHFFYLDEDLLIKYHFVLKYEGVLPTFASVHDLMIRQMPGPNGTMIKVPYFWDNGLIPIRDQDPNPLHAEMNKAETRLYYFEPDFSGSMPVLRTRSLITSKIESFIRAQLDLRFDVNVTILSAIQQTQAEASRGVLNLLVSVGRGIVTSLYQLTVDGEKLALYSLGKQKFDLQMNYPQESWNLDFQRVDSETTFQGIYSPVAARSVQFHRGKKSYFSTINLDLPNRGEDIVGILKSFTKEEGESHVSFFETTDFLRAQGMWGGQEINAASDVFRSSFLPGSVFTQIFAPVVVGVDGRPGVVVDNTKLFSNSIFIYSLKGKGDLSSSIRSTINVPSECSPLTPVINPERRSTLWSLCHEKGRTEMRAIDLGQF